MTSRVKPLQYFLEGKQNSKNILIFMQGWPDNHQVWQPLQLQRNGGDNRLLFINYPNTSATQQPLKWGQDFPVIVERIKATFDEVNVQSYQKKIIIAHDWGCFYTYLFDQKYPNSVNQIITLDVPAYVQLTKLKQILFVLIYQFILIIGFILGGFPGRFLTQGMCKFMKYKPKYIGDISGARNYPYYYLYKNKIKSLFDKKKTFLYKYTPSVPIVYLYATKKPFQFHGDKWINFLKQHDKCQIHGLESGHWIMNKHSQFIIDLIIRRLKSI